MPSRSCFFIKRIAEFEPRENIPDIWDYARGIYTLLKKKGSKYNVVYIGRATGKQVCFHARISEHEKTKKDWSHFSLFEVHDNITKEMIGELEELVLCIYSEDSQANAQNLQRGSSRFKKSRLKS